MTTTKQSWLKRSLAVLTVTSEDAVNYAYCIANGQRTERVAVSTSGDQVSFTVSHFSLWALSDREYETGGEAGTGFFLEDGNYYVDIDLWKSDSNEASMGNVAFKNNDKALITVENGKITRVQIGTNPVDIDPYHSAIIKFELADGTAVSIDATGELTTVPANKNYTYIKLVSFNLPDSAQPDISDAIARLLVGSNHKVLVPYTILLGAFIPGCAATSARLWRPKPFAPTARCIATNRLCGRKSGKSCGFLDRGCCFPIR